MSVTQITAIDIRRKLYFSADINGLRLVTPDGEYELTVAAGEDLMTNFDINLRVYQDMVNR